jgi:O-succinylbenzoic acid--CoA ligase
MAKPLKLVAANDSFAVLVALGEVLAGKQALFVTPPEANGKMPEVHGLPDEVPDNVALIVESSGSTGKPKRIELSLEALLASAEASLQRIGGPGQWLLALPANYIAGAQVLIRSLVSETQPVLMNTGVSFTAEAFVRSASLLNGARRYTSLVPTQLNLLAAASNTDAAVLEALKSFDAILVGGQAPSQATLKALREHGVNIVVTYGMTETAGGCVYDGVPLEGVNIGLGEDGQIFVRGATMANGLGKRFETNDIGFVDAENRLVVAGRRDRVINSGGIKLSLDLVEEWVRSQPEVIDAAALPLESPKYGESFICWVAMKDPNINELDKNLAAEVLGIAASKAVWANVEALPLLPNGKPDLQSLMQNFVDFQTELREQQAKGNI